RSEQVEARLLRGGSRIQLGRLGAACRAGPGNGCRLADPPDGAVAANEGHLQARLQLRQGTHVQEPAEVVAALVTRRSPRVVREGAVRYRLARVAVEERPGAPAPLPLEGSPVAQLAIVDVRSLHEEAGTEVPLRVEQREGLEPRILLEGEVQGGIADLARPRSQVGALPELVRVHVAQLEVAEAAEEVRAAHEAEVVDGELRREPVARRETDQVTRVLG